MITPERVYEYIIPIIGYEWMYCISETGKVISLKRKFARQRELIPNTNRYGYLYVNLVKDKKAKVGMIHRLVAKAFIENPNNYKYVNHKDGNKANNKIGNLEWCTSSQNIVHSFAIGRSKRGEERSSSKLDNKKVLEIRILLKQGLTMKSIADKYGVTHGAISGIKSGRSWSHI